MKLKTIYSISKRAAKLYSAKAQKATSDFISNNNQKRASHGHARLRKVQRHFKTTSPDFVMPYNEWTEEYNVSGRIPK